VGKPSRLSKQVRGPEANSVERILEGVSHLSLTLVAHRADRRQERTQTMVLSAGLFDNALASLGEDGSAALSEDARRRRPVGMVTSDRRPGDARLFSCV